MILLSRQRAFYLRLLKGLAYYRFAECMVSISLRPAGGQSSNTSGARHHRPSEENPSPPSLCKCMHAGYMHINCLSTGVVKNLQAWRLCLSCPLTLRATLCTLTVSRCRLDARLCEFCAGRIGRVIRIDVFAGRAHARRTTCFLMT